MYIRKDVLKLAIPIVLEQAFVISMGMINTMMAGNLGKEAVSAIGMVDSINNILIAFFTSLAVGGTVVVAHYAGQKNVKSANEATKQIIYVGLLISIFVTILVWLFRIPIINFLFNSAEESVLNNSLIYLGITLITYPLIALQLICFGVLRGTGDTKTPMKINIFMSAANMILSYLLIYGIEVKSMKFHLVLPGLGIKGAALGIATARSMGAIIIIYVLLRGSRAIQLKNVFSFKLNFSILKSIFNIGIPAGVESLLFNGGKLITQIFIVSFSTAAIAGNSIAGSVAGMFNVPGNALSLAATTMVGQIMGRGDSKEAKSTLIYLTKLSTVCLAILGMISFPMIKPLVSIYTDDIEVIGIAGNILKLNCVFMIAWSISFVLPAGLKGAGDAKYTMFTSIAGMWLFRIVLGYILGVHFKLGAVGIWLGMYVDWLVRGTLYMVRLRGDKWHKHTVVAKSSLEKS